MGRAGRSFHPVTACLPHVRDSSLLSNLSLPAPGVGRRPSKPYSRATRSVRQGKRLGRRYGHREDRIRNTSRLNSPNDAAPEQCAAKLSRQLKAAANTADKQVKQVKMNWRRHGTTIVAIMKALAGSLVAKVSREKDKQRDHRRATLRNAVARSNGRSLGTHRWDFFTVSRAVARRLVILGETRVSDYCLIMTNSH